MFFGGVLYFLVDHYSRQVPMTHFGQHIIFAFIPTNILMFVLFFYRHVTIRNRIMLFIGNNSYGIFLVHCLFTPWVYSWSASPFPVLQALIAVCFLLSCSTLTIWISRKVLGKNKAAWIGL
jgi:peptidoglycan/LPS O-acetylase OafA/YrhL